VDAEDVWFIRTDASDERFAAQAGPVFAPKLAACRDAALPGELLLLEDGVAILSSHPGRDDYTPAWRVAQAAWSGTPRDLSSFEDVRAAERDCELTVTDTGAVMNAAIVKWPTGELAVDQRLRAYLEGGQLIESPDTSAGEVKFKLHECFPAARYIVTDHSIAPAAEMTATVFAPRLHGRPREAGATGRTNVFMNGLEGPGPMEHSRRCSTRTPAIRSGARTGTTSPTSGVAAGVPASCAASVRSTRRGTPASSASIRGRRTRRGRCSPSTAPSRSPPR
jgi:hypothetical protein